jgi:SAM-dependent methyltransferase
LAEIVGHRGRVFALEHSSRFLDALAAQADRLGLANIETLEQDAVEQGYGEAFADFAWCRWLLCFVADPQRVVGHIAAALKPGGVAVFHEYVDYGAWRLLPDDPDLDRFRDVVMQSWRDAGGDPEVAARLPDWLAGKGLEIVEARPITWAVRRRDFAWA